MENRNPLMHNKMDGLLCLPHREGLRDGGGVHLGDAPVAGEHSADIAGERRHLDRLPLRQQGRFTTVMPYRLTGNIKLVIKS